MPRVLQKLLEPLRILLHEIRKLPRAFLEDRGCLVFSFILIGITTFFIASGLSLFTALGEAISAYFLYPWLTAALSSVLFVCILHLVRRNTSTSPEITKTYSGRLVAFLDKVDSHAIPDWVVWATICLSFAALVFLFFAPKCLDPKAIRVALTVNVGGSPAPIPLVGTVKLPLEGASVEAAISFLDHTSSTFLPDCVWEVKGNAQLIYIAGCAVNLRPGRDTVANPVQLYLSRPGCSRIGPYTFFVSSQ